MELELTEEFEEYKKKYFTDHGYNALRNRMRNLIAASIRLPKDAYPCNLPTVGFDRIRAADAKELRKRAKELMNLLRIKTEEIEFRETGDKIIIHQEDL